MVPTKSKSLDSSQLPLHLAITWQVELPMKHRQTSVGAGPPRGPMLQTIR